MDAEKSAELKRLWTLLINGQSLPVLYKLDSKGKKRQWSIIINESDLGTYSLVSTTGIVGGVLKPNRKPVHSGKGIGKARTTVLQQAQKEAFSRFKSKFKDMSTDPNKLGTTNIYPMLAKSYLDLPLKSRMKTPCRVQPKLDGVRCFAHYSDKYKRVVMYSRDRIEIVNMPGIISNVGEVIERKMNNNMDFYLDGELYKHGWSHQKISGIVRRSVNTQDYENLENRRKLNFWIFDCFFAENTVGRKMTFDQRDALLEDMIQGFPRLVKVPVFTANNEADIKILHQNFMDKRFEGSILRNPIGKYKFGRSKTGGRSFDLQKYKTRKVGDAYIIGIEPNLEQPNMFEFICREMEKDTGKIFKLHANGTSEYRASVLAKAHLYTNYFIRYTYLGLTDDKLPREAVPVLIDGKYDIFEKEGY